MIRVLIVDDHRLVRLGLQRMLEGDPSINVIGEAENGEDGIQLTRELDPDVVLMDLRMPGIGGLEATRRLTQNGARTRVLVVSACDDEPFPAHAIKAGASGFLTKSTTQSELCTAIRKTHQEQRYMCNKVAQQLALRAFEDAPACPFEQLSSREMQIALMIANCHRVNDISAQLHLSPKTVNSYRYRIFEKLGVASDVELALMAARKGMVRNADDERSLGLDVSSGSSLKADER